MLSFNPPKPTKGLDALSKVPGYHRPYPLCIDYLETPDGWWVPDFYEFSGKDDKTAVEHISIYLS